MAFNPFLSMGEPAAAPVSTEALNPFMMTDSEPAAFTGDNPFADSNPFAGFGGGGYEPPVGDTVPTDIFGAEPDGAKHFEQFTAAGAAPVDFFSSEPVDAPRLVKPTELELAGTTKDVVYTPHDTAPGPPPRPLPPETQSLILSVTGQMEVTSSHLLDRIPPTRTPSPVSMRDMCLTPEPDTIEEPVPVIESSFDTNRNKPARPPPARPAAPRPPPPRPAPPPAPARVVQAAPDDINLFDAPVPVSVKPTMQDILSLYSAPKKEEKPIDFLSDDIIEDIDTSPHSEIHPSASTELKHDSPATELNNGAFENRNDLFSAQMGSTAEVPGQMDCSEPAVDTEDFGNSKGSPFDKTDNDEIQNYDINQSEKNPFQMTMENCTPFSNASSNIFELQEEEKASKPSIDNNDIPDTNFNETNIHTVESVPETAQTDMFSTTIEDSGQKDHQVNAFSMDQSDAFENTQSQYNDAFNNAQIDAFDSSQEQRSNVFDNPPSQYVSDPFGSQTAPPTEAEWGQAPEAMAHDAFPESQDAFDAFSAKFDSTAANHLNTNAWGDDGSADADTSGFEAEAYDPFLNMGAPPPPAATPRLKHDGSLDSTDDNFSFNIRPKELEMNVESAAVPVLAPPPRPQQLPESPRVNPFDSSGFEQPRVEIQTHEERRHSGSGGETPPTPLFDDDVSVPLEDFPRVVYNGPGWEMQLRQPNKKKITGQRFWKKVFVRLTFQGDNPVVQLFNAPGDKEPFQELPLQACYSVSEIGAQQFDQYGKIFTVKLQYVFYKERPGVRPGQVTKAERITNKLSQFAAYAIQGDYQGVKEFGSDLRKLGLPVEHAPQVSQLFKLGSLNYEDVKQFSCCIEEAMFKIPAHRDRALTYKMEEVQITAVDELYVEQDAEGAVLKQIARVRVFFLGFLSGMPDIELGVNDLRRQGKEVVGRHDIIPVVTEEWIRVENQEFHACVQPEEFDNTQIIKFKPPDACYIELMRFRVRPPKNRELPLQLKAVWCVTGNKVELRADILVPGFASRKLGQVPCEDVSIRFPIPECWIYLFRVEKHFRYGSVKSAHRRTGKIKGIERFLGAVDTLQESLIEVTSGQAKYEHQHRAIVWRMPRLPKEGQGAYTTHNLVCRMALTSYDQVPGSLARWALVEFTMPATQVSHVTARSVSLQNHDSDPPEKYVRYLARHEYMVGIERTTGQSAPAYAIATVVEAKPEPRAEPAAPTVPQPPSSDSDSD